MYLVDTRPRGTTFASSVSNWPWGIHTKEGGTGKMKHGGAGGWSEQTGRERRMEGGSVQSLDGRALEESANESWG